MSAIDELFSRRRAGKGAAFIPYLTAGDPDLETSEALVGAMARGGADLIELGVPFSDPIADGPVNQRAAGRALASGTTLERVLEMVARVRAEVSTPIVLFTYFNPIHAYGLDRFAEQAAASGVDGVLCVDVPPEEAESAGLAAALAARDVDRIYLVAPTSDRARVKRAAEAGSGFVYYVSRTGVTGVRDALAPELLKEARSVRRRVKMPLAVGFGISTPEQVAAVGKVADGVVVGSALVRLVEEAAGGPDAAELPGRIEAEVRRLSAPLAGR